MRESYVVKYQIHDTDTSMYMGELSGENADEYYRAMYDEIQSFMRRDTLEIVSRKSVADHNVLPGTWSFKCKRKSDWIINKFKTRYCVRGGVQKRLSPETLNSYSPVVQCTPVRLMLILQYILVLQSQSIDFTNYFDQAYIPSEEPVFILLPSYFKSN